MLIKRLSNNFSPSKVLNACLRILPLGTKFLLITVLSKFLSVESYGDYLLITTTITISIFILGLDYYNFSIRDILTEKRTIVTKIYNAFILYFLVYIVFSVIGFTFFNRIPFIQDNGIPLIILLCITEHLNQEIYRLQIAFKKIFIANTIFFFRVFGWTFYFLVKLLFFEVKITINEILEIWLVSNVIALFLCILSSWRQIKDIKRVPKLEFAYLKKGLKISALFFMGTISLKSIEYINRYIVEILLGSEKTGIFSFYSNFVMIISVYINAIVISFELPVIIEMTNSKDLLKYFDKFRKSMLIQIITISLITLLFIKPILLWQDVSIYNEYLYILFFLLVGAVLLNYSLTHHFLIYVKNGDRTILNLTIKAGLINLVVTITLTYLFDLLGTSIAFALTGGYMFYLRYVNAKKLQND